MIIDCHECEHYYVTWDKYAPHGCRAMGFKSRQLPSMIVKKTPPGLDCLSFIKKKRKNKSK
ncbi:conserved hypothetical protein [uncultured Desulfobacterium sp.]|uniref:Uracil-DNA glycosylase n=1 Tax=uncultured Desulfobacterium sp. TaxID=201089 RepID=A0A445MSZ7_9BACT|nr:conserved hypothetical protein [uncultured Desulfobacterium sp.]